MNGADTLYLTAAGQGLAELSGDGTLLRAFLPGPGGLAPAVVWEGGQWRYPLTDRRGSVLLVTDGGSTVLGRARFDAWGRGTPAPGSPFGFTGHRFDSETGLYATPTRHYSPVLGRWLQLDPIGIKDGLNRYAYVRNSPLTYVDPTGQNAVKAVIKSTIKRGNLIQAIVDVGNTALVVIAPESTPLERIIAVAELVSPVAPSDIKAAKNAMQAIREYYGGRKGGLNTRAQNEALRQRIIQNGGRPTAGFGAQEQRFANPNGGPGGARYSDGSAVDANGNPFQVQTVDTKKDGTMTDREAAAAEDIASRSQQPIVCVPKKDCP